MRTLLTAPLSLSLAILAGCAPGGGPLAGATGTPGWAGQLGRHSLGAALPHRAHSLATDMPATMALAALPAEAGEVVTVTQRTDERGAPSQRIVLSGDWSVRGENSVTVRMLRTRASITERAVAEELREAAAGVPMRIDPTARANAYGPFGMASGGANGTSCHYAWQRVPVQGARAGLRRQTWDVRVRLCGAKLDAERFVALMNGLRLGGYGVGYGTGYGVGPGAAPALPTGRSPGYELPRAG